MKNKLQFIFAIILFFITSTFISAQNVGINTNNPEAPLHVFSSGQVQLDSGLVLLGNRSEGHMELDMNRIQSLFGVNRTPLSLLLQQDGGNVGIGTLSPTSRLHVAGTTDQYLTLHKTAIGGGEVGINLLRGGEFSATDWRIINDGGAFKIYDGIDNFLTEGDLNLFMGTTGWLGLGTDQPQAHVEVSGSGNQNVRVHSTGFGAADAGIELVRGGEFDGTDWKIINDGGVLKFLDNIDNFGTVGDENVRMTNSGNVGIGETSPAARLHINGNQFLGSSSGGNFLRVGSSLGSYLAFDNNEIGARNSSDDPATLYFQFWGGNLSLCSNDDGRVGIGTSSPSAKLHITDGSDVNVAGGGHLVLGPTSDLNIAMDGNEIQARNSGAASQLIIQQGGGDIMMVPNETGRVGIGITSIANLPIDYLLAVDGKIISEEVRVELSGSWPDYVFGDSYALTPLDDLERHIKEKGHLPGIPSAVEVENNGIELGDMQKRMMEKIEELTLYMIEANKEISQLKHQLSALTEKDYK